MRAQQRRNKRGFTLVEILVSIAVFAIGGVAILALFIAMADRSRQSIDVTRSTEIAANVRAALATCLKLPPKRDGERLFRQISFPFATLDPNLERRAEFSVNPDYSTDPHTYVFELPTEPYRGRDDKNELAYTVFPRELKTLDLSDVRVGGGNAAPEVFYYLPSPIKHIQADIEADSDVDFDRSESYAFSFFIRRSVQRSEFVDTSGRSKVLVPGLYVVHLRIFKGNLTRPIAEESFTIYAPDRETNQPNP